MRADHCRIRRDRPRLPLRLVAPGPQAVQDLLPRPVPRPATMPVIDGLPVPVLRGQVTPRAARPAPEQDPVDHHAVVIPAATLPRVRRQQRLQPRPLLIAQIMPIQPIISHRPIQAETTTKI